MKPSQHKVHNVTVRCKQDVTPEDEVWLVDHAVTLGSTTELALDQEPGLVARLASMLELGLPSLGDPGQDPVPLGGQFIAYTVTVAACTLPV